MKNESKKVMKKQTKKEASKELQAVRDAWCGASPISAKRVAPAAVRAIEHAGDKGIEHLNANPSEVRAIYAAAGLFLTQEEIAARIKKCAKASENTAWFLKEYKNYVRTLLPVLRAKASAAYNAGLRKFVKGTPENMPFGIVPALFDGEAAQAEAEQAEDAQAEDAQAEAAQAEDAQAEDAQAEDAQAEAEKEAAK